MVGLRRTAAGSIRRALLSASAAANAEDSLAREISFPARSRSSCQRTAAAVANPCPAYPTRRRARREEQQNQINRARIIYFFVTFTKASNPKLGGKAGVLESFSNTSSISDVIVLVSYDTSSLHHIFVGARKSTFLRIRSFRDDLSLCVRHQSDDT